MEKITKARRPVRTLFTRKVKEINDLLAREVMTPDEVDRLKVIFRRLEELMKEMKGWDEKVMDMLLESDGSEESILEELERVEEYRTEFENMRLQVDKALTTYTTAGDADSLSSVYEGFRGFKPTTENNTRSFKLPRIELKTFNGDLKEWLGFWSQFKKIHEDKTLHGSDKFQYLLQAMEPGTEAREIVVSYPQTAENYSKAIEALTERFGRKDLLLQVYVRELLKLAISNATSKEKLPLSTLMIKLESQLRSLKMLELDSADPSMWLFPLVESSLPEETLRAWQRNSNYRIVETHENSSQTRLDCLMEFIRMEVRSEQQIMLAQSGFENSSARGKQEIGVRHSKEREKQMKKCDRIPSVAALHDGNLEECIFCKRNHQSKECFSAHAMTFEDRKIKAKEKKCCYICLRPNHMAVNCKAKVKCFICHRKHLAVMCPKLFDKKEISESGASEKMPEKVEITSDMANCICTSKVVLQTLMVTVHGKHKTKTIRAFLDCGSQRSYILRRTVEDLGLKAVAEESVAHVLFGGSQTSKVRHLKYNLKVQKMGGQYLREIQVRDTEKICQSIPQISKSSTTLMEELKEKMIWISDVGENCPEIELLIGMDAYADILTGKIVPLSNGLTAIETKFGWTLGGERLDDQPENNMANLTITMTCSDGSIAQLWDLETIGILDPVEVRSSAARDQEAKDYLISTLKRNEDGRYVVGLPWADGHPELSCNKQVAENRLQSVSKRLEKENLFSKYSEIFKDWEREGFIEEVPVEELQRSCHYLPHRAVFKEASATTPIRPVFDASCRTVEGVSLNDCLEKGLNYIQEIPELLMRFREKKIGIISDIRKAFQMIEVQEKDRDFLRFLWWEDHTKTRLKYYRHKRVVFGVSSSPFILGAVMDYHLSNASKEDEALVRKLKRSLYVDNCVTSVQTLEDYQEFRNSSTRILSGAKMELRCWEHTSEHTPYRDGKLDWSCETRNEPYSNVLGLKWNKMLDTLEVELPLKLQDLPNVLTKRVILSTVQSIFDVIGFLCPALLPFKILLQRLWQSDVVCKPNKKAAKSHWDLPVSEDLAREFCKRYEEIPLLSKIKIQRVATNGVMDRRHWSLHTFTDASQHAYAAVTYLRTQTDEGVVIQLMVAKARVAPLKVTTIPRLELLGCLIGSRLAALTRRALSLEDVKEYFWTDSTTALAWIRRNESWATFVGNRVQEINKLTRSENWRHISGVHNPADLASRGCYPSELVTSKWWEGPEWLRLPEEEWPCNSGEDEMDENAIAVEKRKTVEKNLTMINLERFRSYTFSQMVRVIGWVRRFANNAKGDTPRIIGPLSFQELKQAELTLIRSVQLESFPQNSNVIEGIQTVRDEAGLLRVKTKIIMREDLLSFRYPLLLPKKHKVVDALIEEQHRLHCHAGIQYLMAQLRMKFWIIQSRRAIKSILSKCVRCKRHNAKRVETDSAPLPVDRIKDAVPFEVTGVDLAGPLLLKTKEKVWIVIYTCAVYRAVHLELTSTLNTEGFLQTMRRFIARRGRPSIIYSDNGTNFVGARNALRTQDIQKIQLECGVQGIEWKLNPPTACWWGGWWERLVRTIKDLLKRMLGKAVLTYNELHTTLCDVEAVINNRPLTYVSENPEDLTPLTPAMFLQEIREVRLPDVDKLENNKFQQRLRFRQHLLKELRQRFRKEYLAMLIQRSKGEKKITLKEGDVVLIGSDGKKRIEWPLARILALIPGRDRVVRVAKLKTANQTLVRPVQRLYPLEVNCDTKESTG